MRNTFLTPKRKSLRLEGYDYSSPGNYFVTIVTQNRLNVFGEIIDEKLIKTKVGDIIEDVLLTITVKYPNIQIPHFVMMPNHIHLIVQLYDHECLSDIIRWFKGYTTVLYIRGARANLWTRFNKRLWQRNYYEHIIRNQHSYEYIANYIIMNPSRWDKDLMNPNHDADCDEIMKQVLAF